MLIKNNFRVLQKFPGCYVRFADKYVCATPFLTRSNNTDIPTHRVDKIDVFFSLFSLNKAWLCSDIAKHKQGNFNSCIADGKAT